MLPITQIPTPELRMPCQKLTKVKLLSYDIQKLIDEMIQTMYAAEGIGLAAPQVAIPTDRYKKLVSKIFPQTPSITEPKALEVVYAANLQICIIGKEAFTPYFNAQSHDKDLILVNPTLERRSRKHNSELEGCLSVLGKSGTVRRMKNIYVKALNRDGNPISFDASNFFAKVCQHEIDHLNGILYVDRAKKIHDTID